MRKVVLCALFAATGCVASDGGADDDGDGVPNIDDFCPGTPLDAAASCTLVLDRHPRRLARAMLTEVP